MNDLAKACHSGKMPCYLTEPSKSWPNQPHPRYVVHVEETTLHLLDYSDPKEDSFVGRTLFRGMIFMLEASIISLLFTSRQVILGTKPTPLGRVPNRTPRTVESRPETDIFMLEAFLYMSTRPHARFRPKPTPFGRVTTNPNRPDVPCRKYGPENERCLLGSCLYMFTRPHARFRPKPTPFGHHTQAPKRKTSRGTPRRAP